jgi:hypothetical protein
MPHGNPGMGYDPVNGSFDAGIHVNPRSVPNWGAIVHEAHASKEQEKDLKLSHTTDMVDDVEGEEQTHIPRKC